MVDKNIILYNSAMTLSILLSSGSDEMKMLFTDHGQEINHWSCFFKISFASLIFVVCKMLLPPIESHCYFTSVAEDLNSGLP